MTGRYRALPLTVALLAVSACGSPDPAPEQIPAATPAPTSAAAPPATTPATTPKAAQVEVPRGVGLDYQSAQDLWRAAGLLVAPAKDATGADRLPVIDANWVVVAQSPKAGAKVKQGSLITATVKKDTDD